MLLGHPSLSAEGRQEFSSSLELWQSSEEAGTGSREEEMTNTSTSSSWCVGREGRQVARPAVLY